MGEALHEPSPCMPYLSVEQQNISWCTFWCWKVILKYKKTKSSVGWKYPKEPRWCLLFEKTRFFKKPSSKPKHKKPMRVFWVFFNKSLFTDLSTVGLPAELKHITQRRKRKQPWFPQSAASEEGPNSLPNRVLQGLELWQKSCLVFGAGVAKFKRKANPLLNTTLHVSIEPKKVLAHLSHATRAPH